MKFIRAVVGLAVGGFKRVGGHRQLAQLAFFFCEPGVGGGVGQREPAGRKVRPYGFQVAGLGGLAAGVIIGDGRGVVAVAKHAQGRHLGPQKLLAGDFPVEGARVGRVAAGGGLSATTENHQTGHTEYEQPFDG